MGTAGQGIARSHGGRFRILGTAEGLPSNRVRSLHQDVDGWLWVGTEGRGLARLDPRELSEPGGRGPLVSKSASAAAFNERIAISGDGN